MCYHYCTTPLSYCPLISSWFICMLYVFSESTETATLNHIYCSCARTWPVKPIPILKVQDSWCQFKSKIPDRLVWLCLFFCVAGRMSVCVWERRMRNWAECHWQMLFCLFYKDSVTGDSFRTSTPSDKHVITQTALQNNTQTHFQPTIPMLLMMFPWKITILLALGSRWQR